MTPVMNLQCRLARERLVAEFTCGVATYCNKLHLFTFSIQIFVRVIFNELYFENIFNIAFLFYSINGQVFCDS